MPYFKMSTANPTGQRPWNFALQGLGRLRGRRMGFYQPADFILPARTLGKLGAPFVRMQKMTTSPYRGKADYGDPSPVYGPLHPSFYKGLGVIYNGSPGMRTVYSSNFVCPPNADCRFWIPTPVVSPTGAPVPTSGAAPFVCPPNAVCSPLQMTWQQQQAINAQQQAANNAAATAAQVAAAQASQSAVATPAAAASSWITDPSEELIAGFPNWALLAIAAGGLLLFTGKRR